MRVFSFEPCMKRLTDEDNKHCLCHRATLYRAHIPLRVLPSLKAHFEKKKKKKHTKSKIMGQQNLFSKKTTFTNCEAP